VPRLFLEARKKSTHISRPSLSKVKICVRNDGAAEACALIAPRRRYKVVSPKIYELGRRGYRTNVER
jgi:hypothetical protein